MNHEFSRNNLKKFYRKKDEYLIAPLDDFLLTDLESNILNEEFQFKEFKIINKYLNLLDIDIYDLLVLRKLNSNIKNVYNVKQSDRNSIIHQVSTLLTENSRDMYITRLDIKDFYQSIDINTILTKLLKNDILLSYHSKYLLRQLFQNHNQFIGKKGLYYGLNLSATLSELYMRDFDKKIKSLSGVYYYARYVDDIIIFSFKELDIKRLINDEKLLPKGLSLNSKKYEYLKIIGSSNFKLDFLGYEFKCTKIEKKINFSISISKNKIDKIKKRIILSFLDFYKNSDFDLLHNRIKFITGNYNIYKNDNRFLNGGLSYNYKLVNNEDVFKELDTFLLKTIFSKKGSLGKKNHLTISQKKILKKYSFLFSFNNSVFHKFSRSKHSMIKRCWK